jgi:hypothetical protein
VFFPKVSIFGAMKHGVILLVYAGVGWMLCGSPASAAASDGADNPYQAILARNIFALKDPPPPPDTTPPPPPLPQVELIGIADVFGVKKALVKIAEGAKPVDMNKDPTVVMAVGQREKDLEVLEIDERAASVKVRNRGTEAVLVFKKDKLVLPTAPPVAPNPAVGLPGFVVHPPGTPGVGIPAPSPYVNPAAANPAAAANASAAAAALAERLKLLRAAQGAKGNPTAY